MAVILEVDAIQLELSENNPYSIGNIIQFDDGTSILERNLANYQKSPNDRFYDITDGDQIWNISYSAYTDSKEWWRIADANFMSKPWELEINTTLLVPDLLTSKLIN